MAEENKQKPKANPYVDRDIQATERETYEMKSLGKKSLNKQQLKK